MYQAVKRILDLMVTAVALVLTSPLFLIIAIFIKLDSPGPVFFIKERVGKNGRLFPFIKFRSMTVDTPYTIEDVASHDTKITKVGKFLRDWTLDEMPQFINIIKGEMSLVGPRPLPPYTENDPKLRALWEKRISVKPGLICIGDIKGRNLLSWHERFQWDSWYIDHQSFWQDLKILVVGFFVVLTGRGVYGQEH